MGLDFWLSLAASALLVGSLAVILLKALTYIDRILEIHDLRITKLEKNEGDEDDIK